MNNTPEQLVSSLSSVKLTDQERTEMRHMLSAFVASHVPSPRGWLGLAVAVAMALVVVGGGLSGLAQLALPGDALYPVKTGVNDQVRLALTFDEDARLDLELDQISRDLSEEQQAADRELTL